VADDQGTVYAAFIEAELRHENERRVSLDGRGVGLITTSSSLVTLLAAVGAFVIRGDKFLLPHSAAVPLLVALSAFSTAAFCGIAATWLQNYSVAAVGDMAAMRGDHWGDDPIDSRSVVSHINLQTIDSLRTMNQRKVGWVKAGQAAQLVALLGLAAVVFIVLLSS
jgi:hypothetical protein